MIQVKQQFKIWYNLFSYYFFFMYHNILNSTIESLFFHRITSFFVLFSIVELEWMVKMIYQYNSYIKLLFIHIFYIWTLFVVNIFSKFYTKIVHIYFFFCSFTKKRYSWSWKSITTRMYSMFSFILNKIS